jgi:phage regulator Rha-like protein
MSLPAESTSLVLNILTAILFSKDNEVAMKHLRELSDIQFLIGLIRIPCKSEYDERLATMLLLTIALHSRTPERKEEAHNALLELNIVCEKDLTYVQHGICECKKHSKCMCCAYLCKLQQLHDDLDQCINEHESYWVYRNIPWIVWLVNNDENLSPYDSDTMCEAFEMVRQTFFMLNFMSLFDDVVQHNERLCRFVDRFIEISTKTYDDMNPRFSQLKKGEDGEDGEYQWQEEPQEKYEDSLFLKENDARYIHIVQILQNKLSESTTNEKQKTMIREVLGRVEDLNTMLHTK